jgi:hypothetical protein
VNGSVHEYLKNPLRILFLTIGLPAGFTQMKTNNNNKKE